MSSLQRNIITGINMELHENIKRIQEMMGVIKESNYEENEHYGIWLHGGTGNFKDGNFLYVTDELNEALHYARLKNGNVYKLKDEYNHIVDWATGHSEGMISQQKLIEYGDFQNVFDLFIEL